MDEMISYCGILCHECDVLIATLNDDDDKRDAVAWYWSMDFYKELKRDDINCHGCLSEGKPVFCFCTICSIRSCARAKAVINCAHCDDYPCQQLMEFIQNIPDKKNRLDKIRENLSQ